ncbi:MAG: hypothetical protein RIT45_881 [Pseudomonadota bacterium]
MAEAAERRLRRGALGVAVGAVFGLLTGVWMQPELPALLADWPLREGLLATLQGADADGLREPLALVCFALAMGLPTWAAARAYRDRDALGRHGGGIVLVGLVAATLVQLAAPPRWSSDAFLFAYYGKIQAVHGENPYRLPGRAFARTCALPALPHRPVTPGRPCRADAHCPPPSRCLVDPFVPYQAWLEVRAAYGPLALGLFRAAYVEALPPEANVWLLRAAAALAWLLATVWALRRFGTGVGAMLAWLPVGVVGAAGEGHLEAFAALALLALLSPGRRGGAVRTGVAWAVLGALKLPLLALGAPAIGRLWRRRGVAAAAGAVAIGGGLVAIGYLALWTDPHPFGGLMDVGDTSVRTPLDVVRRAAQALGMAGDLRIARPLLLGLFGLASVAALRALDRALTAAPNDTDDDDDDAATATATVQIWLGLTALASGIFHPWYAIPGLVAWAAASGQTGAATPASRASLWLIVAAPIVVNGAWLALGPGAFAAPGVLVVTAALFGPALWAWLRPERARAHASPTPPAPTPPD